MMKLTHLKPHINPHGFLCINKCNQCQEYTGGSAVILRFLSKELLMTSVTSKRLLCSLAPLLCVLQSAWHWAILPFLVGILTVPLFVEALPIISQVFWISPLLLN